MPSNDPGYQARYNKAWYQRNKEAHKRVTTLKKAKVIKENRERLWAFLLEHPCADCGELDPIVLEADHIGGDKDNHVSTLVTRGCSWARIERELAKCEIVCANCHRRRTSKRGNHWRSGRKH